MAKLALTFALICFFFAFTHARFSSDLTVNDVVKDVKEPLPESDPKESTTSNIFLPTESSEPDPDITDSTVELKPEKFVESEEFQENPNPNPKDSEEVNSVPLTVITFRPINHRHFPRRPFPLTFRHGHRCHGQHLRLRLRRSAWGPRSYGNDMIVSEGVDPTSDQVFQGGVHQIPAQWVKFRHVDEIESPHHHHNHHHYRHHHEDEAEHEEREHHHEHYHGFGSGFLKGFRKFMNHFWVSDNT